MNIKTPCILAMFTAISGFAVADDNSSHSALPTSPAQTNTEKEDWPLTVDSAVNRIISEMSDESKATIRNMPESNLIMLHHNIGRSIRNRFGLRKGNNALMKDTGASEPDAASTVIIKALWKKLQQK